MSNGIRTENQPLHKERRHDTANQKGFTTAGQDKGTFRKYLPFTPAPLQEPQKNLFHHSKKTKKKKLGKDCRYNNLFRPTGIKLFAIVPSPPWSRGGEVLTLRSSECV